MRTIPQFLIAAPTSGSGKTTVSRGLMALLARKGLKVQPFKCGPDYIDTKYHTAVCGRPSVNLDTFMASPQHVKQLYARYSTGADAVVVEGMMGMFDGYDRDRGSSAEVARLLQLPVVLVVDAKSAAYSMAPLLSGFIHFRPGTQVVGVVFNRVGSPRHYKMLQEVCDDLGVACLGYLPKRQELEQASRHLGLDFSRSVATESLDVLAGLLEEHLDWELLLRKTLLPLPEPQPAPPVSAGGWRILVARNEEAFSFLYEEHLDLLRRLGTLSFFNPENDAPIPPADLLYLPGGYPELHARELARAVRTRDSIRNYIESGGRVLAECGGMIYLSQAIVNERMSDPEEPEGVYPMAGLFPFYISNEKASRKLSLGYRQFIYKGQPLRGHEFHYTTFGLSPDRIDPAVGQSLYLPSSVAQMYNAKGEPVSTPLFRYKNVLAGYTHLYWGEADVPALF